MSNEDKPASFGRLRMTKDTRDIASKYGYDGSDFESDKEEGDEKLTNKERHSISKKNAKKYNHHHAKMLYEPIALSISIKLENPKGVYQEAPKWKDRIVFYPKIAEVESSSSDDDSSFSSDTPHHKYERFETIKNLKPTADAKKKKEGPNKPKQEGKKRGSKPSKI